MPELGPPPPPDPVEVMRRRNALIDAEARRRIVSRFVFNGRAFDNNDTAKGRITGAVLNATLAKMAGAQPGDLRWHGGPSDFVWIAADNGMVPMDVETVIAFGIAAANHEAAHVFAARALKDTDPTPAGWSDDQYWPAGGAA